MYLYSIKYFILIDIKYMKKIALLTSLFLFLALFSADAMNRPGGGQNGPRPGNHNGRNPVGAPLDGGLLLLLGGAGVAYYAARKKKDI